MDRDVCLAGPVVDESNTEEVPAFRPQPGILATEVQGLPGVKFLLLAALFEDAKQAVVYGGERVGVFHFH